MHYGSFFDESWVLPAVIHGLEGGTNLLADWSLRRSRCEFSGPRYLLVLDLMPHCTGLDAPLSLDMLFAARLKSEAGFVRKWGLTLYNGCGQASRTLQSIQNSYVLLGLHKTEGDEQPCTVNGAIGMAWCEQELAAAVEFYSQFGQCSLTEIPMSMFEQVCETIDA